MKQVAINLFLLLLLIIITVISKPVIADSANDSNTQTNESGSNTNITGGYESTTTTTYEDGATNTTSSTSTTTSSSTGSNIPVNSANSPSYSAMSQDVCSMGVSGSISTLGFGASVGKHIRDLNCERIKLSKVLYDYGMKVAAVSILCQDERVFEAMQMAGTPCPFEGKIGKEAMAQWNKYDVERPDYDTYVKKLETRSRIDDELKAIQLQKEQEELAQKIKEEKLKLATLKEQEEVDSIIIETDLETQEKIIINIHE
jgi:hypothetical protein